MQDANLKIAAEVQIGEKINLALPIEVVGKKLLFDAATYSLTLQINENKYASLDIEADSFLAVQNEPEEMPDEDETLDRLLALVTKNTPITNAFISALTMLIESQVFDIPRLIELTNELGPFDLGPLRKCRVCHCTDDDCSQCIAATRGPCSWVEEDLCSRCAYSYTTANQLPPMGNPAWKLEGNEWVYHKELDETPCDDCHHPIKNCTCA